MSGGPDSVALLVLATAARRDRIEAATVDHSLRAGSRAEAESVAALCEQLSVPHAILTAEWNRQPDSALQEQARIERYRLLARWAGERGLDALATAHHLDDQAETLLMRLSRGAGAGGLAGMRPVAVVPGSTIPLVRPLLGWRRSELLSICSAAGVRTVDDPSNADERFERVRVRNALRKAEWLDAEAIARSASHLAGADEGLRWAADLEWDRQVTRADAAIVYRPAAPSEVRRRVVARCIGELTTEGEANPLRGRELDRIVDALAGGATATLRGVLCSGGAEWRFEAAPERRTAG